MKLKQIIDEVFLESSVKDNERINIYRDDKITVVSPLNHRASCKYGANTNWCTSTPSSSKQFDIRQERGDKLIIIIDKNIHEKFTEEQTINFYDDCEENSNQDSCLINEIIESVENDYDLQIPKNKQNLAKVVIKKILNFNKIAISISQNGGYSIWTGENYNIREFFPFFKIEDIGLPQEAIQNIRNFITNK
jgi:hypothetical protein